MPTPVSSTSIATLFLLLDGAKGQRAAFRHCVNGICPESDNSLLYLSAIRVQKRKVKVGLDPDIDVLAAFLMGDEICR